MRGTSIDYQDVAYGLPKGDYTLMAASLREDLPELWRRAYRKMAQTPTNLLRVSDGNFEILFDHASVLVARGVLPEERAPEDRVVAAFGRSTPGCARRDTRRVVGLLGSAAELLGSRPDKGHYAGCVLGGDLDICLYPQVRDLAHEWSGEGRAFRAMTRYCDEHPGTFCFARPIYDSRTWWPSEVEHGLLRADGTLWVQRVGNRAGEARLPFLNAPARAVRTRPAIS